MSKITFYRIFEQTYCGIRGTFSKPHKNTILHRVVIGESDSKLGTDSEVLERARNFNAERTYWICSSTQRKRSSSEHQPYKAYESGHSGGGGELTRTVHIIDFTRSCERSVHLYFV